MYRLAFSPDGTRLALGGRPESVSVYDVASGDKVATLPVTGRQVKCLAFSPDGRHLATGLAARQAGAEGRAAISIRDLDTGQEVRRIPSHAEDMEALEYSADGTQLIALSRTAVLQTWDARTGAPIADFDYLPRPGDLPLPDDRMKGSRLRSASWAVSAVADVAAIGCLGGAVKLMEVSTGRLLSDLGTPEGRTAPRVVFSGDGTRLAAVYGATTYGNQPGEWSIRVFDVPTGKRILRLDLGEKGAISSAAFSPDGKTLVTGMADTTIAFWDVSP
jgi:WD40 repeat protein